MEVVGVDVAGIGAGGGVVGAGELGGCRPLRGPLPRACWRAIPRACVRLSAKLRICVLAPWEGSPGTFVGSPWLAPKEGKGTPGPKEGNPWP